MHAAQQICTGGSSWVTADAWGLEGPISVCTCRWGRQSADGGGDCVNGGRGAATSAIGGARARGFQGGTGFRGRIFGFETIRGALAVAIFDARFLCRRCQTVGRFFGRPSHRAEGRPRQDGHCWEISSLCGGFGIPQSFTGIWG